MSSIRVASGAAKTDPILTGGKELTEASIAPPVSTRTPARRRPPIERTLRLTTGLILFSFATSYFLNHACGILRLPAMDRGQARSVVAVAHRCRPDAALRVPCSFMAGLAFTPSTATGICGFRQPNSHKSCLACRSRRSSLSTQSTSASAIFCSASP
jgi:hypothetical protein